MRSKRFTHISNLGFTDHRRCFLACLIRLRSTCGPLVASLSNYFWGYHCFRERANTTRLRGSLRCLGTLLSLPSIVLKLMVLNRLPPAHMLEHGKQTSQFFDSYIDGYGQKQYKLKSIEQYSREHNVQEQPGKQYFKANTLPEIINMAPMPPSRSSSSQNRPSSTEIERGRSEACPIASRFLIPF